MATKKSMWVLLSVLIVAAWILGSAIQAGAETMNFKFFSHVTRTEVLPVGDTEGHNVGIEVREGAVIFASGELAWMKAINSFDFVKRAGTFDQYYTVTFQDGSKITCHNKGTAEPTPAGAPPSSKWAGEIINGMGRFQGIKGTAAAAIKFLPREKDELGGKALGEATFNYTLP
jgi:hypothetical protein